MDKILYIRKELNQCLNKHRYEHTLGVACTAVCLAIRYGIDLYQAELAGLLHDCAKYCTNAQLLDECRTHHIDISDAELAEPSLLHAKVGALFADDVYHITDPEVLNAVRFHTTGRPDMTLLEKIIFTADYIEPGRDKAPRLKEIRQMAFEDLDYAVWMILEDTLSYLRVRSDSIDETTERTRRYYKELVKGSDDNE